MLNLASPASLRVKTPPNRQSSGLKFTADLVTTRALTQMLFHSKHVCFQADVLAIVLLYVSIYSRGGQALRLAGPHWVLKHGREAGVFGDPPQRGDISWDV